MVSTAKSARSLPSAVTPARTQDEVLRDIKVALATGGANYGRGGRQQGFNPYNSELGRAPKDVWGRKA